MDFEVADDVMNKNTKFKNTRDSLSLCCNNMHWWLIIINCSY